MDAGWLRIICEMQAQRVMVDGEKVARAIACAPPEADNGYFSRERKRTRRASKSPDSQEEN